MSGKTKQRLGLIFLGAALYGVFAVMAGAQTFKNASNTTFTTSGTSVALNDALGTMTHTASITVAGSPATLTVTLQGCMYGSGGGLAGAVCDTTAASSAACPNATLAAGATYTSTASGNICFQAAYDYYNTTATWSGGSGVSVGVRFVGNVDSFSSAAGGGGCTTPYTVGALLYATSTTGCASAAEFTRLAAGRYMITSNVGYPGLEVVNTGANGYGLYGSGVLSGLYGISGTGNGVLGISTSNVGVYGSSTSSYGVQGNSTSSYGVQGQSTHSSGVYGVGSDTGATGVTGLAIDPTGYGGYFSNPGGGLGLGVANGGNITGGLTTDTFTCTGSPCPTAGANTALSNLDAGATGCDGSGEVPYSAASGQLTCDPNFYNQGASGQYEIDSIGISAGLIVTNVGSGGGVQGVGGNGIGVQGSGLVGVQGTSSLRTAHAISAGQSNPTFVENAYITALGQAAAAGYISIGTAFTVTSGCGTTGTVTGGSTAGTFTSGAISCAPLITFPIAAPNGWACFLNDLTTPADVLPQTATDTATVTFSGTTVIGDTLVLGCLGY